MSDPTIVDRGKGEVVDLGSAPTTTAQQIQTEESAKASHEFLEVARNLNSTLENKSDALIAAMAAANRRPMVDDRPMLDDADLSVCRSLQDVYNSKVIGDAGRTVLRLADKVYAEHVAATARAIKSHQSVPPITAVPSWSVYQRILQRANVWSTGGSGAGTEWAPTGMSSQFVDVARIDAKVPALFPQVTIRSMKAMTIPSVSTAASVTILAQATSTMPAYIGATVANPGSSSITLTPVKHATAQIALNMEMIEDSPADSIAAMTQECANALGHAQESGIINGQTTDNASLDGANGPTAANGYGPGLRYWAIVTNANTDNTSGGGVMDYESWVGAWKLMGIFGLKPTVVSILSPKCVFDLTTASIGGTSFNLVTGFGVYGPGTPVPAGVVGVLHGIPIIPTQDIPACLATGKVSTTGNSFTMGLIVDTARWRVGVAREIEVKVFDVPGEDAVGIRGFMRSAFACPAAPTTDDHVAAIINVAA